jgi:hypothetical protein
MSEATLLNLDLPGLRKLKSGKVREVFDLGDSLLIVATDRISAFDCIMPNGIPQKGEVLFDKQFVRELPGNLPLGQGAACSRVAARGRRPNTSQIPGSVRPDDRPRLVIRARGTSRSLSRC